MQRLNPLVFALWTVLVPAFAQTKMVEVDKNQSSVTYTLVHPLHHIEAVSKDAWFRVEVDPGNKEIKSVTAQVDVMTFDSGNSNRDSHAMEVIESIKYPDVTFSSTSVRQAGDSLFVAGKLTFHGVTNEIIMAGAAKWSDGRLLVQGGFDVSLTAFRIQRPSLLMIPVEDTLRFTLNAGFIL